MLVVHPLTGEADYGVIKPTDIAYSIDVNATIKDISWTSWTATGATGKGSRVHDDCNPNCASGKITLIPTTITLSNPVGGQFTSLTETAGGKSQTLTGTGLIEGAGRFAAKLPVPPAGTGTNTGTGTSTGTAAATSGGSTAAAVGEGSVVPKLDYNDPDVLAKALLADEIAKGIAAENVSCVFTAPGDALCQLTLKNVPNTVPARVVVSPGGDSYTIASSG